MFIKERYEKILELLKEQESISVKELSDKLGYSSATIRSDLNYLNKRNLLIRTHGGAIVKEPEADSNILKENDEPAQHNREEKKAIAEKALSYIEDRMSIFIDASSSCFVLAQLLSQADMCLTVLTNGLATAQLLKNNPNITTILIGGTLKGNSNATEGLLGVEILDKLNIDAAFLSAQGFDIQSGMTDFSLYEVELKKNIVEKSPKVYALLDNSKLELTSVASFAEPAQIDLLITDEKTNNYDIQRYTQNGMQVIQVDIEPTIKI